MASPRSRTGSPLTTQPKNGTAAGLPGASKASDKTRSKLTTPD